jgi:hypothetical protein
VENAFSGFHKISVEALCLPLAEYTLSLVVGRDWDKDWERDWD